LRPRIAIATGLVVVGELIDHEVPGEAMIVGEAPVLASRLLTLADPGAFV
jgi:class 3 adenylate cyclase